MDVGAGAAGEPKRRSAGAEFFIRLVKEKPLGAFGGVIVLILFFIAIFAGVIAPEGYNDTHPGERLEGPSAEHILGTDNLGRDLFSRIVYGARISVIVGVAATMLCLLIGMLIGIPSGFIGGRFDMVVQRFVDGWMCFPGLVTLVIMVSILGPGLWQIIIVLGVSWGIGTSRVIRGAVMGIKENAYIMAADSIGCSTSRVVFRHIVHNIMAVLIILYTANMPGIILAEASLSFLGFGLPPPQPSWGVMLSGSGRRYMFLQPGMAIWPGFALALVVFGINLFGDAIRDILDPRLRGSVGRYSGVKVKKQRY